MSRNLSSPSPMQPLSIGNVVTAGIRIYRSHLKSYFLLALKAHLWAAIPIIAILPLALVSYLYSRFSALILLLLIAILAILWLLLLFYCSTKYFINSALLSRLCFSELVNQPESIDSSSSYVNSKFWQFLLTSLLMFLIVLGIIIGCIIVGVVFVGIYTGLSIATAGNTAAFGVTVLIAVVVFFTVLIGVLWLITRFYIFDVPLAVEDNVDATSTISRSWELTKGYVWRILSISFVVWLITLPISIAVQVIVSIVQVIYSVLLQENFALFGLLFFIIILLALSLFSGAVILPFWQAVKAVVYYDLRTRREGLGLKLRDHDI